MTTSTAPMMMTLAQAHALLPGSTLVGDEATPILRVHTDTRTLLGKLAVVAAAVFVAGMAWISTANTLAMSAQLALPNWVRARANALHVVRRQIRPELDLHRAGVEFHHRNVRPQVRAQVARHRARLG